MHKVIGSIFIILSILLCFTAYTLTNKTKDLREQVNAQIKTNDKLKTDNAKLKQLLNNLKQTRNSNSVKPGIYIPHLKRVVKSTIAYLQFKGAADWERLVLLTIASESDMGRYLKQVKGPARGIAQLEPPTEIDVLKFYKANMPETYKRVLDLRMPAELSVHETEVNFAYAIAICIGEYLRRGYRPYGATMQELAQAWKKHYNTYLGKGTVAGALCKTKKFLGNL